MSELIHWVDVKDQLPDDEKTVLIYSAKHDEPVWFGFYESNTWFLPDGMPLLARPTHWAEMPAGPADVSYLRVHAWKDCCHGHVMSETLFPGQDDSDLNATLILDDGVSL